MAKAAGYSGTPLVKKLGLKENAVAFVDEPPEVEGGLPVRTQRVEALELDPSEGLRASPGADESLARLPSGLTSSPISILLAEDVTPGEPNGDQDPQPNFRRGDTNADGAVDIADVTLSLTHQFVEGQDPGCLDAYDVNDDGGLDVSDPISALTYMFLGGDPPPAPGPETCGPDPTVDDQFVDCDASSGCS